MYCTGDFERLSNEVLDRYRDTDITISFGILIADFEQSDAREYIINYLNIFNKRSSNYIDFFIPGYVTRRTENSINTRMYSKSGESYYFDRSTFEDFIEQFEEKFDYKYDFNPVLIIVELEKNNFTNTRKMIVELDDTQFCIKQSGALFSNIFNIAKKYIRIEDISRELTAMYVKGTVIDSLVHIIDGDFGEGIDSQRRIIWKYRVID
jgi:hypothetical protein